MLITDQVAIAPCTDRVQARCPTIEATLLGAESAKSYGAIRN